MKYSIALSVCINISINTSVRVIYAQSKFLAEANRNDNIVMSNSRNLLN